VPKTKPNRIVISRTDSIGDVILTLPLAGILKKAYPDCTIFFLGNTYTRPIISCSKYVDEIWEWAVLTKLSYNEQLNWIKEKEIDTFIHVFPRKEIARLAKAANIPNRIGTSHRVFHIRTCNQLVNFTRKRSPLHEAQLNTKLLSPLGLKEDYSLSELSGFVGYENITELNKTFKGQLISNKTNVVLHPKSQGSAVEWGIGNFIQLAMTLDPDKYEIFFTGTEKESQYFRKKLPQQENIHDLSGKMTLDELVSFIANSDVLIAASTGPLHMAGVSGIKAIGLFADVKPIHPGRWKPLGEHVIILTSDKKPAPTQPLEIEIRDVIRAVEQTP
jgi:ADP-heptose:LPS heptosyltransferase